MTTKDLKELLNVHFSEVLCERLVSKHPDEYASFIVSVYEYNYSAVDPSKLPQGVYVQPF